jgi:hypothetical protein
MEQPLPPGQEHPEHILWYVLGDLPREQMSATRAHLLVCAPCRDECKALVSMLRALKMEQEAAASGPDSARARQGPAASAVAAPPPPAAPIRLVPRSAQRPPGLVTQGRVAGSLLLALFILAVPAVWSLWRPVPAARSIEPAQRVTLLPPVRGAAGAAVLEGNGPWLLHVVLPFGAPAGPYSLRLGTGRGTPGEFGETVAGNSEGSLELIVQPLPSGRYLLTVDYDTRPPHDTFLYRFEVRSTGLWGTTPDARAPGGR